MRSKNTLAFAARLLIALLLFSPLALAGEPESVRITQLSLAEDHSAELGPEEAAAGGLVFYPIAPGRQSLGSNDSAFWLKLQVENSGANPARKWLEVGQARLHEITLFEPRNGDWNKRRGGTSQPFSARELPTLTQTFSVDLAPGASRQLLVRVASDTVMIIHPRLWSTGELMREENHNTQLEFFMAGAVVLMLLFGLVMWAMLRESGFLVFGLISLCFLLFRWSIKGIAFREFWPDSPQLSLPAIGVFWALVGMLIVVLHRILLQTRKHYPTLDRVLIVVAVSFALFAALFFVAPHRPLMHAMSIWGLVTISLFSPVLGYMAWRKGVVLWGYAFASYVLPWQVTQLLYFASIGWLPALPGAFADRAMAGATIVASVIILSGLAARMMHAQREKTLADAQRRANLEHQVAERTRALNEAKEVAEDALDEHRQFLAMISHELRSPITSISSACELLEAQARNHAPVSDKVIQRIRRAVTRTRGLLDNLIAEDRLESRGWQVNWSAVEVEPLLNSIVEQAQLSAPHHQLVLETQSLPGHFNLDAEMIRIMLANLLENACKYSPPEERVLLRAHTEQNCLLLDVIDRGPGIPEKERERVFKKYVRGHRHDESPGTGMGLYIVRRIVDLHHGKILFPDSAEAGFQVRVQIPDSTPNPPLQNG